MTARRYGAAALLLVSAVVLVANRALDPFAPAQRTDQANTWGALVQYLAVVGVLVAAALFLSSPAADRAPGRIRWPAWLFLCLGVGASVAYLLLGALGTGIGAPTDIGGGLIAIGSYVLTAVGIFKGVDDRNPPPSVERKRRSGALRRGRDTAP